SGTHWVNGYMVFNVFLDGRNKVSCTLEDTPPNLAAAKDAKPDLHLIQPGGRGWRKMQVIPGMFF
ncbi:hypothetical protein M1O16_04740, partial [Dehalococcoidia bacterium]|nr:hypothetical protein [Dehalococcoidia bacterium]